MAIAALGMEQSLSDWKICQKTAVDAGGECIRILYNNSMWTSRVPELIDENEFDDIDYVIEEPCDDYDYQFNAKENRAIAELIKKEPK